MLRACCEFPQNTSNQAYKMKSWLLIIGAVTMLLNFPASLAVKSNRVVCYHGSWSVYRPGDGKFEIENIDPNLCTHGIYTFVGITWDGGIRILDSWNEIDKGGFTRFNGLKQRNPDFKTLVAIGGWNEGSITFSSVVNDQTRRATFVRNIVDFVRTHQFDGFDLDWEYPGQRGGAATDKAAFSQLLQELRTEFNKYGFILSAAVAASEASASLSYNIPDLNTYLDFINIMSYDMHGSWDPVTGHNSPLYPGPVDDGFSVHQAIQYWINAGATPEKINLGIGTYGRSFTLSGHAQCALGAPASGAGHTGPYTREAGFLGYNEICEQMSTWNIQWDNQQQVSYACKGNQFVGYDDVQSTKIKAEYAVQQGLGGVMIWSVETDDFLGKCHGVKYPLLTAINEVLYGTQPPTTAPPSTATPTPSTPGDETTPPSTTTPTPSTPGDETTPPSTTTGGGATDPSQLCTQNGFLRDLSDWGVFYQCHEVGDVFIAYRYECPAGLVFDTTINVCNWE